MQKLPEEIKAEIRRAFREELEAHGKKLSERELREWEEVAISAIENGEA